jgi:hypothetical protein
MSIISALGEPRQDDSGSNASLSYIVRPCLKDKKKKKAYISWAWGFLPIIQALGKLRPAWVTLQDLVSPNKKAYIAATLALLLKLSKKFCI